MTASDFAAAIERFGWNLLAAQDANRASTEPQQNVFLSPLSMAVALGMLLNGAGGQTRQAILDALTLSAVDLAEVNEAIRNLMEALSTPEPKVRMTIANALWADRDVHLAEDFRERCLQYCQAEAHSLDFRSPASAAAINVWAAKQTQNAIPSIVSADDLRQPIETVLTNAVYFYGPWTHPFRPEHTVKGSFTFEDGTARPFPMMSQTKVFPYAEGDTWQAVRLPYGNGRCCLDIYLPHEGSSAGHLLAIMKEKHRTEGLALDDLPTTHLTLPRFWLEFKADLVGALRDLGMDEAFGTGADFTPMGLALGHYVGAIHHKTVLKVNEKGTEAAAVTAVGLEKGLGPKISRELRVDRPFLCVIRDSHAGIPLFMGIVREPQTMVPTYDNLIGRDGGEHQRKEKERKALQIAVQQDDMEAAIVLLDAGVNINPPQRWGIDTPLAEAASGGSLAMVQLLLDRGANPRGCPKKGLSVVMAAASHGHMDIVSLLLDQGAEMNCRVEDDKTALMQAASASKTEIVKLLAARGADLEIKDRHGETALLCAIRGARRLGTDAFRSVETVTTLLEHGASIHVQNDDGETPLMLAASGGQNALASLLIQRKAKINQVDLRKWTALHWAACDGTREMIGLLLDAGAKISARDQYGKDALRLAAERGREDIVQVLLERGGNPALADKEGVPTWTAAARAGQEQIVRILADSLPALDLLESVKVNSPVLVQRALSAGADPNATDGRATALMWATRAGHTNDFEMSAFYGHRNLEAQREREERENAAARENVLLLLKYGADVRALDGQGRSVLWWAASRADPAMLTLLLDRGAAVDGEQSAVEGEQADGGTPLLLLAQRGKSEAARVLLEPGADPNARYHVRIEADANAGHHTWASSQQETTSLMWAAKGGYEDTVVLLLSYGADPSLLDAQGLTASDWAMQGKHPELASLLKSKDGMGETP